MTPNELRDKKLIYKARRGLKEIDFFLDPYMRGHFAQATEAQKQTLEQLLECEDPDLMDWFLGVSRPEQTELAELVELIRSLKQV